MKFSVLAERRVLQEYFTCAIIIVVGYNNNNSFVCVFTGFFQKKHSAKHPV